MKANEVDILVIISTIIILFVILMMVLVYIFYVRKKGELLLLQKEKEMNFQQELTLAQIEMREVTLTYIGQELHDDIGQKLSVAKLMINQVIAHCEESAKSNLNEINELLGETIQDLRNMSKTFITDQVEHFGLIDSLEIEMNRISRLKLIDIEFRSNKHDIEINPKDGVIIFRIIQESVNNTLKHSKAKNLNIQVEDAPRILTITITDNGIGIDERSEHGSGLSNMKKRALMMNADLQITSEKNVGTVLKLIYPKK
ncbi:MAG: histidine kinase [Flavobacteriia bacterium]|nr:histidine kinase [Flavobacteriia bacterium]MBH2023119.1 histidine kinase [Flavobacteriales bacterium]